MSDNMNMEVPVTFECKQCGGKELLLPDEATDDSIAKCNSCGIELGRWGDIKDAAGEHVVEEFANQLRKTLREAFEGDENITFE